MSYTLRVPWRCPIQVERKTEALEVLTDSLVGWVAGVERQCGRKLGLERGPHGGRNCRGTKLGAFGVEIPAKPLKMPANEHHVTLEALMGERRQDNWGSRWSGWRSRSEERGAVRVRMSQSQHSIVLPANQGGG